MRTPRTPSIIFIDDDIFFAQGYIEELEKQFQVTVFRDVGEAEAALRDADKYLLAVFDVMMPVPASWPPGDHLDAKGGEATGIIALRRCIKDIVAANLPIIVLTNRQPEEMRTAIAVFDFPSGLIEVHHKLLTPAFRLPSIVSDVIHRVKGVVT